MIFYALSFLFRTGNGLFGGIHEDIVKIGNEFSKFFEGCDFLPSAFSGVLEDESVLREKKRFLNNTERGTFINSEEIFQKQV